MKLSNDLGHLHQKILREVMARPRLSYCDQFRWYIETDMLSF